MTTPASTAEELAGAAGASDLFVFRKISFDRFAHVGGAGRGAGWAGIVEVTVAGEPLVSGARANARVVRHTSAEPTHILGPYYSSAVAIVPVSDDIFVVFGAADNGLDARDDATLVELARTAGESLVEVAPAKRLADELETMNAIRDLLRNEPVSFEEALQTFVDQAAAALSCDLGLAYLPGKGQLAVRNRLDTPIDPVAAIAAFEELAQRTEFPLCVQEARANELPSPFGSQDGIYAYYLLELERPEPGLLLLMHAVGGVARGFTLLCQSLGAKLVEASEPFLAAALQRDSLKAQVKQASSQARQDPLTGLANRLAWDEALALASPNSLSPISVIQVDCRALKRINDTRGHHIGDQHLRRIAALLGASVRGGDLVARLGGDEFGILLYGADEMLALTVVRRIEAALEAERDAGNGDVRLAIGHATTDSADVASAHRRADRLMLAAKGSDGSGARS